MILGIGIGGAGGDGGGALGVLGGMGGDGGDGARGPDNSLRLLSGVGRRVAPIASSCWNPLTHAAPARRSDQVLPRAC